MGVAAAALGVTSRLLLDEHYSEPIAVALRALGHDVVAVVAHADLRGASDPEVFRWAAEAGRRVVTENIKDFRPLLLDSMQSGSLVAPLLCVSPRRFPRGRGDRTAAITASLDAWLTRPDAGARPLEDWLVA